MKPLLSKKLLLIAKLLIAVFSIVVFSNVNVAQSQVVNYNDLRYLKALSLSTKEYSTLIDSLVENSQISALTLIEFGKWAETNRFAKDLALAEKCYFSANALDSCIGNIELYKLSLNSKFKKSGYKRMMRFRKAYSRAKKLNPQELLPYEGICEFNNKEFDFALMSFQNAGEYNNAVSLRGLGLLYYNGWGCEINYELAYECFLKSAILGNADSQYSVSQCLYKGIGCSKNDFLSYLWAIMARFQGNEEVTETVDFFLKYSNYEFRNEDVIIIDNNLFLSVALGLVYYDGDFITKDYKKAFTLLNNALENPNQDLMSDNLYAEVAFRLGILYRYGRGVEMDQEQAIYWTKQASSLGHLKASRSLLQIQD